MSAIGGILGASQNLILAGVGFAYGEHLTGQAVLCMMLERCLDAALISAGMILTMLNRNPIFQILAILSFYVWLTGQTIQPVSIAAFASDSVQDLSIESTKYLLSLSQSVGDLVLPTINVYDLVTAAQFSIAPLISYASAVILYLSLAVHVTNKREFFYGTN
jgi:hypothetical protein